MSRVILVLNLIVVGILAGCGGGSAPAAPSTGGSSTPAAFSVTGVTPASPTISALAQTLTITGTGFTTGMQLLITPPMPPTAGTATFSGPQILNLTPTSFQVSYGIGLLGAYTFQVTSAAGEKATTTVTPQYRTSGTTWIPEGVRLRDSQLNSPIGDMGVLRLNNGQWRMFITTNTGQIRSAISPDGLAFTVESGARYSPGFGPRVVRLDDGRVRMFYNGGNPTPGFSSAISSDDGLTWTNEGLRLSAAAAGETGIITPGVVRFGGVWRAYFSDINGGFPATHTIHSATSTDMLNWTADPGFRLGPGAPLAAGIHPTAFVNEDGTLSLFYGREGGFGESAFFMWTSRSNDGMTFTTETKIESLGKANDPEIVRVGGSLRMYYDWGDEKSGVIYSAISASGAPQSLFKGPIR